MDATITIRYPKDSFDYEARFTVARPNSLVAMRCYLFCVNWRAEFTGDDSYSRQAGPDDDKVFCMQSAGVLKSHYTERDIANGKRLREQRPIEDGDIVEIEGKGLYRFKLNGDYSDAGLFIKI